MILIADSGSTKTSWALVNNDDKEDIKVHNFQSIGLNPYYTTPDIVLNTLIETFVDIEKNNVEQVFFYGAGCSNYENQNSFKKIFSQIFPKANIEIDHDMLAAARALCKNEPGVAAILGTGCNSCVFDGKVITYNNLSLGYILGDEGSGSYIGKQLIKDYLNHDLPSEVRNLFKLSYSYTDEEIINSIYKKAFPNRFLASFAQFVIMHKEIIYCQELINASFYDFIHNQLTNYIGIKKYPIHFTGSIAYYLKNELKYSLTDYGYIMGNVIADPINELVKYHTNKM